MVEVKKKIQTYKGKTIEELKNMDTREFAKLLPARQRRTVLRNFQKIEEFISRSQKKISKNKKVRTHFRDFVIVPKMVGMNIQVYNGRKFEPVEISFEMIGQKLGELSLTRARIAHTKAGVGATKGSKHKSKK